MSFDFGATPVESSGGSIKQAAEGDHAARIAGILHLGMYEDMYQGKKKPAAPFICVLYELKDEEDFDDNGNPLVVHDTFALKKNEKARLTKFMEAVLTVEEFKQYTLGTLEMSFDDFVGRPVQVNMKGGKALNDDGTPQYTNVSSVTRMPKKLIALTEELTKSFGHIRLNGYTAESMKALPPFVIYDTLEKSLDFPGSKAEEVLLALRKENPDYATKKAGSAQGGEGKQEQPAAPREDLNGEQEF